MKESHLENHVENRCLTAKYSLVLVVSTTFLQHVVYAVQWVVNAWQ